MYKALLYLALIISVITYFFWREIHIDYFFYYGNALFIFLLCSFIFLNFNQYWITFLLFSLSLNNLIDELFFDNSTLSANELFFLIIIIIVTIFKYARKTKTK